MVVSIYRIRYTYIHTYVTTYRYVSLFNGQSKCVPFRPAEVCRIPRHDPASQSLLHGKATDSDALYVFTYVCMHAHDVILLKDLKVVNVV